MNSGTAIVTGAQRGIGKAIAIALADAGYAVAAVDLEVNDSLMTVKNEIAKRSVKAAALACDIADIYQHEKLLESAERELGPVTTLVNNAGVGVLDRGDLLNVSVESYDRCQSVNTRGTFFLTQRFAQRLLKLKSGHHRSIVNITSANATALSIARGEYCISKAAASMMSKLFAARLSNEGIGVYEIQPGLIETEMTKPVKEKYQKLVESGITEIKRLGQPEDVARIAVTLAQGLLTYTSGQIIHADGGLLSVKY